MSEEEKAWQKVEEAYHIFNAARTDPMPAQRARRELRRAEEAWKVTLKGMTPVTPTARLR